MVGPETPSTNENVKPATSDGLTLAPFRYAASTVLWIATVVSNVGVWMQNAAAGWLMTGLTQDPFLVSMVQVATSIPMFVLALPSGALSDIVDRRRVLIGVQAAGALTVAVFGFFVLADRAIPSGLIAFVVLAGTTAALIMPTWQSIVPQLVPRA
jgi:MFS family permease